MAAKKGLISTQAKALLESRQRALICALVMAVLPCWGWVAMVIVALVTLRKGEGEGGELVLAVMIAHTLAAMAQMFLFDRSVSQSLVGIVLNTTIFFVPCYLSACVLRITRSWFMVAMLICFMVLIAALAVKLFIPDWTFNQFKIIKSMIETMQNEKSLAHYSWDTGILGISERGFAELIFGLQMMSGALFVFVSLLIARTLQSSLYYPKGLSQELLGFRGDKISSALFILCALAAWKSIGLAINLLPVFGLLYVMAGLSVLAKLIIAKAGRLTATALLLPLALMPAVAAPMYIVVGLLDTLIHFNLVFSRKRG